MTDARSPRPFHSRRGVLAAASAAPTAAVVRAELWSVAELARAWNVDRNLIEGLSRRWQRLETDLKRRTGSLDFTAAADRGDSGACEMIAIDRRLPALFDADEAAAEHVAALPCATLGDALGKLQMGIRMIGPHDGEGPSHALLLGGYEDLVRLLGPRARQ